MNVSTVPRLAPRSSRSAAPPRPQAEPRDTIQLTPLAHRKKLRPYVLGGLLLGGAVGMVGSVPGALFLGSLGAVVGLAVGSILVGRPTDH